MTRVGTWLPLYVTDYLADTQRLTTEQHGAYLLIIMDYWRNGPPPDDDDVLAQIARLDRARWRKHRGALAKLFRVADGEWRHKRIDAELDNAKAHAERRSASAKKAADARWSDAERNATGNANGNAERMRGALPDECATPSPSPSQEEEDIEKEPLPHRALAFSGRIIRLNQRDLAAWEKAYHGIPDLAAELTALDDWLRNTDDPTMTKRWFHVVSGALAKKHQAALKAAAEQAKDDATRIVGGPC